MTIALSAFRVEGPAAIQCSFGRTSGYLLWLILQAHGGRLPPDVHVMFENTGKEPLVTLRYFGPGTNPEAPEVGEYKRK